jgi:polyferredoxin
VKIERDAAACLACNVCSKQCPMGIPVATLTRVDSPECMSCLECVGACPAEGGLDLKLSLARLARARSTVTTPVLDLSATTFDSSTGGRA